MDEVTVLIMLAFGAFVSGIIGAEIASARGGGRGMGFGLGALLGPVGWLIVFLSDGDRPKCPECLGSVPAGAKKCRHCGSELRKTLAFPIPDAPDEYFLWLDGEPSGPHTEDQIDSMLGRSLIASDTPCCRNGDDQWGTVEGFRAARSNSAKARADLEEFYRRK